MFKHFFDCKKCKEYENTIRELNGDILKYRHKMDELNNEIENLKNELNSNNLIENTIDVNKFLTNEYRNLFNFYMLVNDKKLNKELLKVFNSYLNEEKTFFRGVVACIDFIRTKRNKKISTEKQLLKYIFTDEGRLRLEEQFNTVYEENKNE